MTVEEMIKDFSEQLKNTKSEITELKDALKAREDQVLRLSGAIEALRLSQQQTADVPEEE
jgi:regulator of replication initiation timing